MDFFIFFLRCWKVYFVAISILRCLCYYVVAFFIWCYYICYCWFYRSSFFLPFFLFFFRFLRLLYLRFFLSFFSGIRRCMCVCLFVYICVFIKCVEKSRYTYVLVYVYINTNLCIVCMDVSVIGCTDKWMYYVYMYCRYVTDNACEFVKCIRIGKHT